MKKHIKLLLNLQIVYAIITIDWLKVVDFVIPRKISVLFLSVFLLFALIFPQGSCIYAAAEEPLPTETHSVSLNTTAAKNSASNASAVKSVSEPSRQLMDFRKEKPLCFGVPLSRYEIRSITFLNTIADAPEETWDASAAGDGSVLSWTLKHGRKYDLFIAAEGGVIAPQNCSFLFMDFREVEEISFNDAFDTSEVISMSNMFQGCKNLTELDLSCFDTSCVVNMSGMFSNCSRLYSLDLSSFNTSAVTGSSEVALVGGFNRMFMNCSRLNDLDLSSFDTSNAVVMTAMFQNCSSLSCIDLSSFTFEQAKDVRKMFEGCPGVTVDHVKHFQFDPKDLPRYKNFMDGSNWMFLFDPNAPVPQDTERMLNHADAYWCFNRRYFDAVNAYQIKTLTFLDTLKDAPADAWDASYLENRQVLAWAVENGSLYDLYIAAEGGVVAPYDCSYLFEDFSKLERIYFNDAFHTSFVTDMTCMFEGCKKLKFMDLRGFDTSKVVSMGGMFSECGSLRSLDVSSFNTSRVTNMAGMFFSCSSLKELELYNFETSSVIDMGNMFYECRNLEALDLSSFDTRSVQEMCGMFEYSGLSKLDISSFDTSNVISMDSMFSRTGFHTLDLSHFDTSNVRSVRAMFMGCSSLEVLDVSRFDTSSVTSMTRMFADLYQLKTLDLASFTFENAEDVSYMFQNTSCVTPKLVKSLPIDPTVTTKYENFVDGTGWESLFQ